MTATEPQTWNGEGPAPIYDADRLVARIDALDEDRQIRLGEAWAAQGQGSIAGRLLDAETYRRIESLVSGFEPGATGDDVWARMNAAAEQFYALPAHIKAPCAEALSVYAGIPNPGVIAITSVGRVAEMERIVGEAVAYAAEQEPPRFDSAAVDALRVNFDLPHDRAHHSTPSVADLPPADDTADQIASDTYPGTKAKADVVLAWVNAPVDLAMTGDIRTDSDARLNRAARAYANEQDRATQRKGLTAKLVEILGPDGLAKVNETLAANAPAPLDLGGGPTSAAEETVGAGPDAATSDASVEGQPCPSDVEAAPAPAVDPEIGVNDVLELQHLTTGVDDREWGPEDLTTQQEQIRQLYRRLADAYTELAEVL